jgi:hypothetical protein
MTDTSNQLTMGQKKNIMQVNREPFILDDVTYNVEELFEVSKLLSDFFALSSLRKSELSERVKEGRGIIFTCIFMNLSLKLYI